MKQLLLFAGMFFCLTDTNAQTPDWAWVNGAAGTGNMAGSCVSTDALGNFYVAGNFTDTVYLGNDTLMSPGGFSNIFIAKFNPSGNVIWAKVGARADISYVSGLCTDAGGNVYLTGIFLGLFNVFGADTLYSIPGDYDAFIAKYDSSGNLLWAKNPRGFCFSYSLTLDVDGNAYIAGTFVGSIAFGSDSITGDQPYYIAKYDGNGNEMWAKASSGSAQTYPAIGISTDAGGNILVSGTFIDTIAFGIDTLKVGDVFLEKYDSSGNVAWAKSEVKTTKPNWAGNIVTDAQGNSYISVTYTDTAAIGTSTFSTDSGYYSTLIVKYDASGNLIWAKNAGGQTHNNYIWHVNLDGNDNVYLAGYFGAGNIVFGADTLTCSNGQGNLNPLFVKYDSSGNEIWARSVEGNGQGEGISADASGNVYVTGNFDSTSLVFDSYTLTSQYKGVDGNSFFVAKLANAPAGIATINQSNKIILYPNPSDGNFYFEGVQNGYTIEVFNLLGERIYVTQSKSDTYDINLSGQAKGMYLYKVSEGVTLVQQGKMIVE